MAAAVHIVCGPAGSGKTRRLMERCRERAAGGSALWLTPTLRRAEQIRALLGAEGCVAVHVATFGELAVQVIRAGNPKAQPLSQAQRRLIADDVADELHQKGRLRHFGNVLDTRGFSEGMLELLEELKVRDVSPERLAAAINSRDSRGRDASSICSQYEERLTSLHLVDREGQLHHARDLLEAQGLGPLSAFQAIFADDFTAFTPPQVGILDAFRRHGAKLHVSLPDEPGDDRAELFGTARRTLQDFMSWQPQIEVLGRVQTQPRGERTLFDVVDDVPAGLAHLERELFRPIRAVRPSKDAAGLMRIEAPGLLGEARMVAREIKALLLDGTTAEEIVVAVPDLSVYADLIGAVFDEYGIPVDIEGAEPLTRDSTVALLLRVVRLPDDDWPFAGVTALLRSSLFKPAWPEVQHDADVPQKAEALLRLLGIPRGRETVLAAVRRWAEQQQPGLEDEDALESRRARTHELARDSVAFLERFFDAWDPLPQSGPLSQQVRWLREFAAAIGLMGEGKTARFFEEIDCWCARDAGRSLPRHTFLRRLSALAIATGAARTPRGPGRVRVLSADLARHLDMDYLFVLGLGERGFPRLTPPAQLLDEGRRQQLREAGVNVAVGADMLPAEMLLFYQLVTRPRRRLTLSYPAVDQRGQPLLPGSFLNAVTDCFEKDAIPVQRRTMLIEGVDRDTPLSPAEWRVRMAREYVERGTQSAERADPMLAKLADCAELIRQRLQEREFTPYDGCFRNPAVIAGVHDIFRPERVFSPTALEDYATCPFRFFLRHALRLEPLEEPREDIEVTRRGQAFHRALARLHRRLSDDGIHQPAEAVDAAMLEQLNVAIREDIDRANGPAAQALWEIEGRRMLRVGAGYREQWQAFIADWAKHNLSPQPVHFEVDFGLPPSQGASNNGVVFADPLVIRDGDVEVRVSGRIDRVDMVERDGEVGFWIIDYKTGKGAYYKGSDLTSFRKLQLTLYALAVEEVLLKDRRARPLGLAYWLVADTGPKVVLPTGKKKSVWLNETQQWQKLRTELQEFVAAVARRIRQGAFPLKPQDENCTATCDYGQICRITQARAVDKKWSLL